MTAAARSVLFTATIPITLDKFGSEYVRQLQESGQKVILVSSDGPEVAVLRTRHPTADVRVVPMARAIAPWRDAISLFRWLLLLMRTRPARVISITPKASLLAMLTAAMLRVPQRTYLTGGLRLETTKGLQRGVLWVMERVTCVGATEVVANSPSLGHVYVAHRLSKPPKLRWTKPGSSHGVDVGRFHPGEPDPLLAAAHEFSADAPIVGFFGRLTRDKGIDTLVAACDLLHREGKDFQLAVVGAQDEPDSDRYVRLLQSCDFDVRLIGAVEDVRPFLSLTAINVLPSLREGFPNAVLEAAAMGVPSVVSDATGCVDSVIEGRTGLIAPAGDQEALAGALARLIDDKALRTDLGQAARSWVERDFQPRMVVGQVLSVRPRDHNEAEVNSEVGEL